MDQKERILIVDDSEINRELLSEMLSDEFLILEAKNGEEAIALLQSQGSAVSLVLLDMVMPGMDGLEVLGIMGKNGWLSDIPVIMISSEDSENFVQRAYELGVTEYIRRPFDMIVVKRRCKNVVALYSKQKKLVGMVADQFYENEKNSRLMISILAHIVEFRNGESGMHVINVQNYTEILLKRLVKVCDKYKLTERDIMQISNISALHDIGKISIPDEILNKPGRLTSEEFAIMKTHATVGAQMLSDMDFYHDEPIVKLAYEICRWHHERFDGRGYPDGLKEDEIPISAQVVSIADVYDALTSERVYKKAFPHEMAMEMITKGECGSFNPVLLDCLRDCGEEMRAVKEKGVSSQARGESEVKNFAKELLRSDALYSSDGLLVMLEYERMKNRFFESVTGGCSFEYNAASDLLTLSKNASEVLKLPISMIDPVHHELMTSVFGKETLEEISAKLRAAYPEYPVVSFYFSHIVTVTPGQEKPSESFRITASDESGRSFPADTKCYVYKLVCRTTWSSDEPQHYTGAIGKIVPQNGSFSFLKGALANDDTSVL